MNCADLTQPDSFQNTGSDCWSPDLHRFFDVLIVCNPAINLGTQTMEMVKLHRRDAICTYQFLLVLRLRFIFVHGDRDSNMCCNCSKSILLRTNDAHLSPSRPVFRTTLAEYTDKGVPELPAHGAVEHKVDRVVQKRHHVQ